MHTAEFHAAVGKKKKKNPYMECHLGYLLSKKQEANEYKEDANFNIRRKDRERESVCVFMFAKTKIQTKKKKGRN